MSSAEKAEHNEQDRHVFKAPAPRKSLLGESLSSRLSDSPEGAKAARHNGTSSAAMLSLTSAAVCLTVQPVVCLCLKSLTQSLYL